MFIGRQPTMPKDGRFAAIRSAVPSLIDDLVGLVIGYDIDYRVLVGVVRGSENCVVCVNPTDGGQELIVRDLPWLPENLLAPVDVLGQLAHLSSQRSFILSDFLAPRLRWLSEPNPHSGMFCCAFPLRRTGEFAAICQGGETWRTDITCATATAYRGIWNMTGNVRSLLNADLRRLFLTRPIHRTRLSPGLSIRVLELGGTDWYLLIVHKADWPVVVSVAVVNVLTRTVAEVEQRRLCDDCSSRQMVDTAPCFDVLQPLASHVHDATHEMRYPYILSGQSLRFVHAPGGDCRITKFAESLCDHDHAAFDVAKAMRVHIYACHAASAEHIVLLAANHIWCVPGSDPGTIALVILTAPTAGVLPTRYYDCFHQSSSPFSLVPADDTAEETPLGFWKAFVARCATGRSPFHVTAVVMLEHSVLAMTFTALPDRAFGLFSKTYVNSHAGHFNLTIWALDNAGIPRINTVSRNLGNTIVSHTWSLHQPSSHKPIQI